ncbi:MAG: bacterial Ig-like protein, partial [Paenibacillus sp.]|nr:bacterial Ig-like protein [Paenibacillus sp.]
IPNLANAYTLTGDILYAYKAAILIGRIAELYPYMNGGYHDGSYSDTVHIAEPSTTGTEWKKNLLEAYDLIFDDIDLFHSELKAFFASQPDAENKKRQQPFDLRRAVEQEMVPYIIYACELERSGASDWSMRLLELEVETAALIQNGELLHTILLDSKFSLFSKLKNGYYRDGKYAYDSSQYVEGMSAAMMRYPDWAYLFQDDEYFQEPLNLFEDSRFGVKEAIAVYYKYKNGSLSASFGDTTVDNLQPVSDTRKRGLTPYLSLSESVFRRMPSAREVIGPALALYTAEELNTMRVEACMRSGRGVESSLLLLANALSEEELAPYRAEQSVVQPSYLMEDSEISILRTGTSAHNTKHVVLYGQPTLPHCHGDKLGLWIGAYGIHMLAHGGHYPYIWIGPKITQWELHSASCNVVLIDGRNQAPSSSIQLEHYEGTSIQLAGLESTEAYPGSHYERWTWLIQAPDGENAYVFDLFNVSNGTRFDYNTHGLDVQMDDIVFEGVKEWTSMTGTLAGSDVPLYSEPGYGWMKDVRTAKVDNKVSWTYSQP